MNEKTQKNREKKHIQELLEAIDKDQDFDLDTHCLGIRSDGTFLYKYYTEDDLVAK